MADETGSDVRLPAGYRWRDLIAKSAAQQFAFYKSILRRLGADTRGRTREIFNGAETSLTNPTHLSLLVSELALINWYSTHEESALGDVYEGLLEKNSIESKAGAGQYFTPRAVIESMVEVTKPSPGEIIQDPACGTGGFLIAADRYIKRSTENLKKLDKAKQAFQRNRAFIGVELVEKTHRLALMNAMLHGIYSPFHLGDTLGDVGCKLVQSDVILTNPPFGTKKGGGLPSRTDFKWRVSNKQLCFLQHIYQNLRPRGRAAVVMPDLQGGAAPAVCGDLMEKCRLHTILRLPAGIFYAAGVKTNVLFFVRRAPGDALPDGTWVYDLRSSMPQFGKRTPLTREHLKEFEKAYGPKSDGTSPRVASNRFRHFSRDEVRRRGDTLDLGWRPETEKKAEMRPEDLLAGVLKNLQVALSEVTGLEKKMSR